MTGTRAPLPIVTIVANVSAVSGGSVSSASMATVPATGSLENWETGEKTPISISEASGPPSDLYTDTTVPFEVEREPLSTSTILWGHIGATLSLFLATTDATVISTSLPTIVSQLHGSQSEYNWVGVVYLLTQTACQPFWGTLAGLIGQKTLLYVSIATFLLGSLFCGLAQTMLWLIGARAIAGMGAGGIVACVWVLTAQLVPSESRARWSQALSVTWSCSAIAGPLLSGALSDGDITSGKWRWAFLMNLPIGIVSAMILFIALRHVELEGPVTPSFSIFMQSFDALGLLLFLSSTVLLVFGFGFASQYGWTSPLILSFILLGFSCFVSGMVYECKTDRDPVFPRVVFTERTLYLTLVVVFFHSFVYNSGTFFLSVYYQAVNGSTPLQSGLAMLPYSLGSSLASVPAAWIISLWQRRTHNMSGQKITTSVGLVIATLGSGILILLNVNSPESLQEIAPLLAGIGLGMLFHAPYQIYVDALGPLDLATATGAFFMIRFMGSTLGLSLMGAVLDEGLATYLPPAFTFQKQNSSIDLRAVASLQPPSLKAEVLVAIAKAVRNIWIISTPCLGIAVVASVILCAIRSK